MPDKAAQEKLQNLIDALPHQQKEAIHLRFQRGWKSTDIAVAMGQTPSYVAYLTHQAMTTIRSGYLK